jgi:hypothetical protein
MSQACARRWTAHYELSCACTCALGGIRDLRPLFYIQMEQMVFDALCELSSTKAAHVSSDRSDGFHRGHASCDGVMEARARKACVGGLSAKAVRPLAGRDLMTAFFDREPLEVLSETDNIAR